MDALLLIIDLNLEMSYSETVSQSQSPLYRFLLRDI